MKNSIPFTIIVKYSTYFFCSTFLVLFYNPSRAEIKTSYYYDSYGKNTIHSVSSLNFKTFEDKVNQGLKNGVYWIKINNDSSERLIEITSARIKKVTGYINKNEIQKHHNFSLPTFELEPNQELYLQILCEKEACIPIATRKKSELINHIQIEFLFYGLYYGFALVVITINLFYLFNFKEITFLYYALFLLGIMFILLYRDGFFHSILKNEWILSNGETIFHFASVCLGSLFASVYLRHEIHFPGLRNYTVSIAALMFLFYILNLVTNQFIFYVLADLCGISLLAIYWISSVLLFRKNTFYAFFSIAYSLILGLSIDFFILPLLGLPNIGITTLFLKTASVFEMMILSYAVVYRMKIIKQEYSFIQQALFQYTTQIEKMEVELSKLKSGEENRITAATLSTREVEILSMIANGIPSKEIADKLFISINTVKYHIKKLYDKLEISTRQEAKIKAAYFQDVK